MIGTTDFVIPREYLVAARMSDEEMRVELATHLYQEKRLSMGRAKQLAGMDLISFQKELAKRNIYIHYTVEDLEQDLATIDKLEAKFSGK